MKNHKKINQNTMQNEELLAVSKNKFSTYIFNEILNKKEPLLPLFMKENPRKNISTFKDFIRDFDKKTNKKEIISTILNSDKKFAFNSLTFLWDSYLTISNYYVNQDDLFKQTDNNTKQIRNNIEKGLASLYKLIHGVISGQIFGLRSTYQSPQREGEEKKQLASLILQMGKYAASSKQRKLDIDFKKIIHENYVKSFFTNRGNPKQTDVFKAHTTYALALYYIAYEYELDPSAIDFEKVAHHFPDALQKSFKEEIKALPLAIQQTLSLTKPKNLSAWEEEKIQKYNLALYLESLYKNDKNVHTRYLRDSLINNNIHNSLVNVRDYHKLRYINFWHESSHERLPLHTYRIKEFLVDFLKELKEFSDKIPNIQGADQAILGYTFEKEKKVTLKNNDQIKIHYLKSLKDKIDPVIYFLLVGEDKTLQSLLNGFKFDTDQYGKTVATFNSKRVNSKHPKYIDYPFENNRYKFLGEAFRENFYFLLGLVDINGNPVLDLERQKGQLIQKTFPQLQGYTDITNWMSSYRFKGRAITLPEDLRKGEGYATAQALFDAISTNYLKVLDALINTFVFAKKNNLLDDFFDNALNNHDCTAAFGSALQAWRVNKFEQKTSPEENLKNYAINWMLSDNLTPPSFFNNDLFTLYFQTKIGEAYSKNNNGKKIEPKDNTLVVLDLYFDAIIEDMGISLKKSDNAEDIIKKIGKKIFDDIFDWVKIGGGQFYKTYKRESITDGYIHINFKGDTFTQQNENRQKLLAEKNPENYKNYFTLYYLIKNNKPQSEEDMKNTFVEKYMSKNLKKLQAAPSTTFLELVEEAIEEAEEDEESAPITNAQTPNNIPAQETYQMVHDSLITTIDEAIEKRQREEDISQNIDSILGGITKLSQFGISKEQIEILSHEFMARVYTSPKLALRELKNTLNTIKTAYENN